MMSKDYTGVGYLTGRRLSFNSLDLGTRCGSTIIRESFTQKRMVSAA
jgi:hypothetical protein